MKSRLLTKNPRRRRGSPRVSLFPFLAVLICTMGALVVLLFMVMRQSRLQAVREAQSKIASQQNDVQAAKELVQWRIEQLKESRAKTEAQLVEARLALGHLEDHARQLRQRLEQLEADCQRQDQTDGELLVRRNATKEEVQRLETQVAEAERRLAAAREAAKKRPQSYAVIPYEGPNQTHRRPLYLECREDAVILQPEGIRFTGSDFEGPMGAGNPLATALRAAREHLLAQGGFDPDRDGEPYPLLLVRPSGISVYYAAQEAMKSWGPEFGYELIGEDWKLSFPPPDIRLAATIERTVAPARARQRSIAAAAPRIYGGSKAVYRVSPSGGGVVRENTASSGGGSPGLRSRRPTGPYGDRYAGENGGSSGTPGLAEAGGIAPAEGGFGSGLGGGSGGEAGGSYASGMASGGATANERASSSSGGSTAGRATTGATGGVAGATGSAATGAPGRGAEVPEGYVKGRPVDGTPPTRARPVSDGAPGSPLRPGEWQPYERPPEQDEKQPRPIKSLAEKRGQDWGLRNAARGSVPVTRPIRVECFPDRLILVPEPGAGYRQTIALDGPMDRAIDGFISAVWEHMDSWGIAGKGMYWRPVLSVRVEAGAEARFAELRELLEGSGLTVQRKQ